MTNIALLMGSFNPVHVGHVAIAQYALEQKLAAQVWFVVSPQNPFKEAHDMLPWQQRVDMVRQATQHNANFHVCDIEGSLPHPSYTINTVEALMALHPDCRFTILCGSDIAQGLPQWYKSEQLQRLVTFMIYPRGEGRCSPEMRNAPQLDVSSTAVRTLFAQGQTHYSKGDFGHAINDFNRCLELSPYFAPAQQMVEMTKNILDFRHTDYYNV